MPLPRRPADPHYVALRARALGVTQVEIAGAVTASQSQVSRVLAGESGKRSHLLDKICIYVESRSGAVSATHVCRNAELIDALAFAWDGTPAHATALAAVIRSLVVLRPTELSEPHQRAASRRRRK